MQHLSAAGVIEVDERTDNAKRAHAIARLQIEALCRLDRRPAEPVEIASITAAADFIDDRLAEQLRPYRALGIGRKMQYPRDAGSDENRALAELRLPGDEPRISR